MAYKNDADHVDEDFKFRKSVITSTVTHPNMSQWYSIQYNHSQKLNNYNWYYASQMIIFWVVIILNFISVNCAIGLGILAAGQWRSGQNCTCSEGHHAPQQNTHNNVYVYYFLLWNISLPLFEIFLIRFIPKCTLVHQLGSLFFTVVLYPDVVVYLMWFYQSRRN